MKNWDTDEQITFALKQWKQRASARSQPADSRSHGTVVLITPGLSEAPTSDEMKTLGYPSAAGREAGQLSRMKSKRR